MHALIIAQCLAISSGRGIWSRGELRYVSWHLVNHREEVLFTSDAPRMVEKEVDSSGHWSIQFFKRPNRALLGSFREFRGIWQLSKRLMLRTVDGMCSTSGKQDQAQCRVRVMNTLPRESLQLWNVLPIGRLFFHICITSTMS